GRGVQNHNPPQLLRFFQQRSQTDWPTPVVNDQVDLSQSQAIQERPQVPDVFAKRIIKALRFIGQPASEVIGYDASNPTAQAKYNVPIVKRPGRIAVDHDHRFVALAFVQITHHAASGIETFWFE